MPGNKNSGRKKKVPPETQPNSSVQDKVPAKRKSEKDESSIKSTSAHETLLKRTRSSQREVSPKITSDQHNSAEE